MSGTGYSPPNDHPIFVAGTAINTSGGGYRGAVGVRVRNITGWLGEGVEVRDTRSEKPGRDGEYADEQWLGGRTVTFEGTVIGSSYADLQSRKNTLAAVFNAIARDEGIVKLPQPSAVSPSFTWSDSMSGFERINARLVGGGIAWGERFGLWGQRFQVSVRASDPLIYSDVETTVTSGAAISYPTGYAPTPAKITVTSPSGSVSRWGTLFDEANATFPAIFIGDIDAVDDSTTQPQLVVDSAAREAYLKVAHKQGRLGMLSPVALWPFNETAGTVADNAQGTSAYDGTYVGTPTLNQTGPATGLKAVSLNGSSQEITVPYSAALYPSEWTIEGWFKNSSGGYMVSFIDGSNDYGLVLASSSQGVFVAFQNSTNTSTGMHDMVGYAPLTTAGLTTWHHLAVTYRDGQVRTILDGELVSATRKTFNTPPSGTLHFGKHAPDASPWYSGMLSQWAIYSRALSDAEIAALYDTSDRFSAKAYSGPYIQPIVEWPMVQNGTDFTAKGDILSTTPTVVYREARL